MNTRRLFLFVSVLVVAALAVTLTAALLQAQEAESTPESRNEALRELALRIVDEAFMPGDMEVLDNYLHEDYIVHSPFGDLDRETTKGFLGGLRNALTEFEAIREPVVVEGDYVAARNVWTGVFSNEFDSPWGLLEPTNEPLVWEFILIFRYNEDNLIIEEWVQTDVLGLMMQLGAPLPESEAP